MGQAQRANTVSMKRTDFQYELPSELIAQTPLEQRSASRLLCLDRDTGGLRDRMFSDLPGLLRRGDLLVFNNTQVIPARLFGNKASGGRVEILLERLLNPNECLAQVRASKSPRSGSTLLLEDGSELRVLGRQHSFFHLRAVNGDLGELLDRLGHMPLPPYITRQDTAQDRRRYQTVFAEKPGAVAAPTAGLHFDHGLLEELKISGIESTTVTLHVGAGPFNRSGWKISMITGCTLNGWRCHPQPATPLLPPGPGEGGSWRSVPPRCAASKRRPGKGLWNHTAAKAGYLSTRLTGSGWWMP